VFPDLFAHLVDQDLPLLHEQQQVYSLLLCSSHAPQEHEHVHSQQHKESNLREEHQQQPPGYEIRSMKIRPHPESQRHEMVQKLAGNWKLGSRKNNNNNNNTEGAELWQQQPDKEAA
jgi:hypothetical protein